MSRHDTLCFAAMGAGLASAFAALLLCNMFSAILLTIGFLAIVVSGRLLESPDEG